MQNVLIDDRRIWVDFSPECLEIARCLEKATSQAIWQAAASNEEPR